MVVEQYKAEAENDGIARIRKTYTGFGYIELVASTGEKRVIAEGAANTVLANHGWPKANKNFVLWAHSRKAQ